MLIDLLSSSNYVCYNTKVAEILGLHQAIYLSELMSINDKAIRKDKLSESSFLLDREYIRKRTTISPDDQLVLEQNLIKLGIIEKPNNDTNCIILHINILTTLMMSSDEELIDNVKTLTSLKDKTKSKTTKAEAIRQNLKSNIVTTNVELLEAYSDWIDAVFAKEGWMSKKAVVNGQNVVDEFSNRNLDIALEVLSIAAMHGYRDMTWAVNKHREQYKFRREIQSSQTNSSPKVKLSSEVF